MTTQSLKTWAWVHKWTSLVCTAFMLLLCITGLPLIFAEEINDFTGRYFATKAMPANTPDLSLDKLLAVARSQHPKKMPLFLFRDEHETTQWTFSFGDSPTDEKARFVAIDSRNAAILGEPKFNEGFIYVMFKLHVDLFAGLPGTLFLGFMGLLLLAAIVSGVVLYAPFMRKLNFGEIRKHRTERIKRIDTHNYLGAVVLIWLTVVALTGVINTLSELVIKYWQNDQMAQMVAPYKNKPIPAKFTGSLQAAIDSAIKLEPNMKLDFVAFPGSSFSSKYHYGVFMRGNTPVTSRLLKPVLIDAQTNQLTDSRNIPWYLSALLISQPLHFGDYGGLALKIIWTLFDLLAIAVLWTGLKLWWKKCNQHHLPIEQEVILNEAYS